MAGVCYLSHKPSNLDWDRDTKPAFSLNPTYACFLKQISKVQIQLSLGLQTCHSVDQCATSAFYSQNSPPTHTPTLQILPLPLVSTAYLHIWPLPTETCFWGEMEFASKKAPVHPRSLYWFHCPGSPLPTGTSSNDQSQTDQNCSSSQTSLAGIKIGTTFTIGPIPTAASSLLPTFCIQYPLQLHVPITFSSMRADYQNPLLLRSAIKGGEIWLGSFLILRPYHPFDQLCLWLHSYRYVVFLQKSKTSKPIKASFRERSDQIPIWIVIVLRAHKVVEIAKSKVLILMIIFFLT